MRRRQPRALGSLRNPFPPQASPLYVFPTSVHLIPSQQTVFHPAVQVNPLSVFYPTTFPSLRNTSYFPTFMMAMPSSSCLAKISSNCPVLSASPSHLSTLMTTSPKKAPMDRYLLSVSRLRPSASQANQRNLKC
uniref:Predicted gene 5142 n=1 Tax=Mus spicilegus TaxID=10103 RepID=A0A8C6GQP7_MUSSI